MTTETTTTTNNTPRWNWADDCLTMSNYADFQADDCEYFAECDEHRYFDEDGNTVTVDSDGFVTFSAGMMFD